MTSSKCIDHEKLKAIAKKHIDKNYDSFSACSLSFNEPSNFIHRCMSGERHFPVSLLEDMGYELTKDKFYYKIEEAKK